MIYSHSPESEKFFLFSLCLQNLIEGNKYYENTIKQVISDAHNLVLGYKNYYTIDRENYTIIVYLSKKNSDFIKEIDPEKINKKQYVKILDSINNYNSISAI